VELVEGLVLLTESESQTAKGNSSVQIIVRTVCHEETENVSVVHESDDGDQSVHNPEDDKKQAGV
jgi:hypothetical protein